MIHRTQGQEARHSGMPTVPIAVLQQAVILSWRTQRRRSHVTRFPFLMPSVFFCASVGAFLWV